VSAQAGTTSARLPGRVSLLPQLLRRKSASAALEDAEHPAHALRRSLGAFDLTLLGIGAIVGAGLFSSTGRMAAGSAEVPGAGPALIISYVITALVCGFSALCYAEIAALVPVAGSAYTYAYVALGELVAWIIGWDLIIEYAFGNVFVAQSWAGYFGSFLSGAFGLDFPPWMKTDMFTAARLPEIAATAPHLGRVVIGFNLPAILIVAGLSVVLVIGIRASTWTNRLAVGLKMVLVVAFVAVGAFFMKPAHFKPFAPHGWTGIWRSASIAFFSYIGFDAVSTAGEETRDPQRNLPRGIIGSLIACTVLYVATSIVMVGLAPASALGVEDPLAFALRYAGLGQPATIMSFGAVLAMTTVLLVFQLGQARIFMAMSRDGLLPPLFGRVHPRFRTPVAGTLVTGAFVAIASSIIPPEQCMDLTNIGTLFAFIVVCGGVIALRIREPGRPRPFRVPGYPVTPVLSILFCVGLMIGLPAVNWIRLVVWLALGLVVYFFYGRKRSRLAGRAAP
jgi:APA family basic amino acid/polyamine antiporter